MTKTVWSVLLFGALVAGCASESDSRVSVEPNALGVASIETAQYVDHGDRIYELRGLSADDHEVGQVRLRIGTVADLPGVIENDDHQGSEIVMSFGGHESHIVSRQKVLFALSTAADESTQTFLEIPTVAARLAHDANIIVAKSQATGEEAFATQNCPTNQILTTPHTYQCCYDGTQTMFSRAGPNSYPTNWGGYNGQSLVTRKRNAQGTTCKASDGTSSCSGTACYYGPQGYNVAAIDTPGNFMPYSWKIYSGTLCNPYFNQGPWSPTFAEADGTASRGAGCCVNGTGACANATACAACGGGSANAGFWDY